MKIIKNLPFITKDLPGIKGEIRNKPEDFIVEEVPVYEPSGKGNHLFINITKKDFTTKEIQKEIASLLYLKESDVGFAGLKDKHAVTTQSYSIPLEYVGEEDTERIVKKIKESLDVKINWTKLHKNKLKSGHLLGNKFTIRITSIQEKDALSKTKKIIEELKKTGLPNYFGLQRFGINQDNIEKGLNLIKGNIKIKDRWLKRFLISSYQSYLCNLYLAERINSNNFNKILKGDIAKKYDTGGLFEVEDPEIDQKRYDNKEISFTAPIYGTKMWDAKHDSKKLEQKILEKSDITMQDLEKTKIKGTRRLGRVLINDIEVKESSKDIILTFFLPKGSFATTLLREIMKIEVN